MVPDLTKTFPSQQKRASSMSPEMSKESRLLMARTPRPKRRRTSARVGRPAWDGLKMEPWRKQVSLITRLGSRASYLIHFTAVRFEKVWVD